MPRRLAITALFATAIATGLLLLLRLGFDWAAGEGRLPTVERAGFAFGLILFALIAAFTLGALVMAALAAFAGAKLLVIAALILTAVNWTVISPFTFQAWTTRIFDSAAVDDLGGGLARPLYAIAVILFLLPVLGLLIGRR
jgi:hypothetical protein